MRTTSAEAAPREALAASSGQLFPDLAGSEPIRAELYGLEHLEAHARHLAEASATLSAAQVGHPLLRRFRDNGRQLTRAHHQIALASRRQEVITPDAEWLLDNFHIVTETLREIQNDLPRGYYQKLPKLAAGPPVGLPRVYALALAIIAHTDSSLDESNITRFVQSYQTVTPLTIGELWAVPIMLRLGLLENLRRLAQQMLEAWAHRREAEICAAQLLAHRDLGPQPAARPTLLAHLRPRAGLADPYVVRLLQALRDHGPEASALMEWLESYFADCTYPPAEVLHREHQRQAANQVSVGNCVTSLRLLAALDWTVFFERTSLVETLLHDDPAGVYTRQDFTTKDRYRQAVEKLARGSVHDELSVTRRALMLARGQGPERLREWQADHATGATPPPRPARTQAPHDHVGYYLIGAGRPELERELAYHPRLRDRLLATVRAHPGVVYLGALAVVFGLIVTGIASYTAGLGWGLATLLLLAALLPASELAVGLVHYLITLVLLPRVLPKLDFRKCIPADCATFVVMPTMLIRPESAIVLTDRLEVHYLSNSDPQFRFALLTDFADAPTETMPEDEAYLRAAQERIQDLNARYAAGGPDRFFLFHRRRMWNPVQNCWMGWERKRGKLLEFNRLLRGARDTSFTWTAGEVGHLPFMRFVITLDADTQLPRETAQRLVGTLAHPLNQPHFDLGQGRVVEGYGVLQPRVSLSLVAATRSLFARILSTSAGIDPYTTAVSDVYQDLFGSGSFTGKGIYDVDAFEAAVGNLFPENHILSHDLIEGNYARCGLVTDIELLDDFPSRYHAYARREHRWARGDWQLLPWLLPSVPAPPNAAEHQHKRPNPLPALERWKIFDNLRRSLLPPGLVLLLVLGWLIDAGSPWFWTLLGLSVLALPLFLTVLNSVVNLIRGGSWWLQAGELARSLRSTGGQTLLIIVFLAEQAASMLDAVTRTLVRLTITHRHLLEWETAATTELRLGTGFVHFCATMWLPPLLAVVVGGLVAWLRPDALVAAGPLLLAWLVSPAVAFWVSRPQPVGEAPLDYDERHELRRVARKTWSFFETFVVPADHWLPPDNYQEDPKGEVAHRTSPTNMGLYLLSSVAAHDFGYLSLGTLVERLERTFTTLGQLERYHGHFYNWYDTRTLRALQPAYISTVDIGNFLGCLLALKQGLREKVEERWPGPVVHAGLSDTLNLIAEEFHGLEAPTEAEPLAVFRTLELVLQDLLKRLEETPSDLLGWRNWVAVVDRRAAEITGHVEVLRRLLREAPEDLQRWAAYFAGQVQDLRRRLVELAPWLPLLAVGLPTAPASLADRWQVLLRTLTTPASVADWQSQTETLRTELAALDEVWPDGRKPLADLREAVAASVAPSLQARCQQLADQASALAGEMDFKMLYNEARHLFSIGYNRTLNRLDNAHYDLLASEACLTSFLAIARGDVPKRHWFHLGRLLTRAADGVALLSWGGTMFEYLMPRLLLRSYAGTLLEESCRAAVGRQIEYGRQQGVPWGISESAYSAVDAALDYQYQSFGVPGLGLKRGLGESLVIAPYATALALLVRPRAALENFRSLRGVGAEGPYGFYEAMDYSRDRLAGQRRPAVVRSFMAHHQGMSLLALADCLQGERMVHRFHAEPIIRATELLLQERVPAAAPLLEAHGDEAAPRPVVRDRLLPMSRRVTTPNTPYPRTHLLSNGRYTVMVTNTGSGWSTYSALDVTRWREDRTRDCWGQFYYIRDLRSGLVWSAGHQPLGRTADDYEVVFSTDKAEFHRFDAGIETHLEIVVSPENAAEVRRITFTNHNARTHELEVTSYAEVVLGPHGGDLAHPAFGKLFLETEFVAADQALLCRRRPRAADQKPVWAVHVVAVDGRAVGELQYETDRARFLGRGRTPADPAALEPAAVLSGTTGPVLDPIFSLRRRIRVAPGATVIVAFTTAVADSREEALALADQYHNSHGVTRAFELAWAHTQVQLRHLHLSPEESHLFQRLAAPIIFAGSMLRAANAVAANQQGQPGLWRHGISGDRPIVLVRIADMGELSLVGQLLLAHTYWRLKGLAVDLVFLNENPASYLEELHEHILNLVRSSDAHSLLDKPGGVFIRKAVQMSEDDRVLLQAAASVVLAGNRGTLARQVDRTEPAMALPEPLVPSERRREDQKNNGAKRTDRTPELLFWNGQGGFTPDGREYILEVPQRPSGASTARPALPPAPWINVVANPAFGFLVSEGGAGYTWAGNSQMNRLTPWNNDPVTDPPGEVVYLRDDATGEFWNPTPLPGCRRKEDPGLRVEERRRVEPRSFCRVRHGQGYTIFEKTSHGLAQELLLFVPAADPIKVIRLKVRNLGRRPRQLSATFYAELVLGTVRDQAAMNVVAALDAESGALVARNAFNGDFASRVAFADVSLRPRTFTCDRGEFLGRNGAPEAPAALGRMELSGRAEPTLDPCAAVMAPFNLQAGEEKEVVFFLGQAANLEEARQLLRRYRQPAAVGDAFQAACRLWDQVLTAVQVRTPESGMDLLLNRWLLYQVLSCRVWGRSAFYQSGGAYGFRDQLQDVMALVHGAPQETRAQLLRAAARQFLEGDVQHWWHPPAGRGVRTRISDDFLWLPLVACQYVAATGDVAVLDERVPFLRAPVLRSDQEEDYGLPERTEETATLYEHCVRAVEHGFRFGAHGLPLMGTGDWNDGMNRIGAGGKGESVWNGWFLLTIIRCFVPVVEARGEAERAARYRDQAERLRTALEAQAWDGHWYRRAYFDDGTPLGSQQNAECQIDSIAQTWAVIAGAADPERTRAAMAAVEENLVRQADQLILLFTPPFDRGTLQPGYVKGYVPGIRENGGQYTHAATWVVQATALQGQGNRAFELFKLLSPIPHTASPEAVARYRVEPYVVAADVYGQPPHTGRGGWTWYTGSAGWLYRVGLESILGFHREGNRLRMEPCFPSHWPGFTVTYRHGSATYKINVENPDRVERGVRELTVDGVSQKETMIALADDGREHQVRVILGT
jgi:cyclic beta-1,2-glucan synthetase